MSNPSALSEIPETVKVAPSLLKRARAGDAGAIVTIFRQFIPEGEDIFWAAYLGRHGWVFGRHSIACLTSRRAASIMLGSFGEVVYSDGYLEYVNSTVVYQPSKLWLYVFVTLTVILDLLLSIMVGGQFASFLDFSLRPVAIGIAVLFFCLAGLVLVNLVVRLYYSIKKCGLVLVVKDGVSVYAFTDRKRSGLATAMLRMVTDRRDERIAQLGHLG